MPPGGQHHSKLVCSVCGAFIKWMAGPALPLDPAKVPQAEPNAPLPVLVGTVSERQANHANNMRNMMLSRLESILEPNLFAAMRLIPEAGFWMGNAERQSQEIRWPKDWCQEEKP